MINREDLYKTILAKGSSPIGLQRKKLAEVLGDRALSDVEKQIRDEEIKLRDIDVQLEKRKKEKEKMQKISEVKKKLQETKTQMAMAEERAIAAEKRVAELEKQLKKVGMAHGTSPENSRRSMEEVFDKTTNAAIRQGRYIYRRKSEEAGYSRQEQEEFKIIMEILKNKGYKAGKERIEKMKKQTCTIFPLEKITKKVLVKNSVIQKNPTKTIDKKESDRIGEEMRRYQEELLISNEKLKSATDKNDTSVAEAIIATMERNIQKNYEKVSEFQKKGGEILNIGGEKVTIKEMLKSIDGHHKWIDGEKSEIKKPTEKKDEKETMPDRVKAAIRDKKLVYKKKGKEDLNDMKNNLNTGLREIEKWGWEQKGKDTKIEGNQIYIYLQKQGNDEK